MNIADTTTALMSAQFLPSVADGGGAPEWIHLLPAGVIGTGDKRGPYRALNVEQIIADSFLNEAKLPVDVDEYIARFATGLVDLVFDWCGGAKFADLCKMTDAYEGSIIRAMHRLEELLRQIIDAAKVVGNEELQAKCEAAQKLLVRDVVFCPSLYT